MYSVMADTMSGTSHLDQLSVIARCYVDENGMPQKPLDDMQDITMFPVILCRVFYRNKRKY